MTPEERLKEVEAIADELLVGDSAEGFYKLHAYRPGGDGAWTCPFCDTVEPDHDPNCPVSKLRRWREATARGGVRT